MSEETSVIAVFHYTDKAGWNAIRSQRTWRFVAAQPNGRNRPFGAYFTDIAPTAESLRTLHKRLRVPKVKQEFVFAFEGSKASRSIATAEAGISISTTAQRPMTSRKRGRITPVPRLRS
jgi:hypothetical protein